MKLNFISRTFLTVGIFALSTISGSSNYAVAGDIETQDIILSANGASWDYNAAQNQGWVQHTVDWQPTRPVQKVLWRCVDNCKNDEKKFDYKIKLRDQKIVLMMRATTKWQGLIRVQLTALVE